MRKPSVLFLVFLGLVFSVKAQTYSFKSTDIFFPEIQPFGEGVYCLFKSSPKKSPVVVYKKIFLDANLKFIDSVSYSIEGKTQLLASCSNEKFVIHAFYAKTNSLEKIVFIVTDHLGRIQSTFFKTAADFSTCFSHPIKNLKNFSMSFVVNNGNSEMLLIQPYQIKKTVLRGKLFSLNAEDGNVTWKLNAPPLSRIRTTDSLLIGLTTIPKMKGYSHPLSQINFVDKQTGQLIKSVPFNDKVNSHRVISVFATNGKELMIAGSEFESSNMKNGKFFMTQFNLSGEKIFDHVDSSSLLSTKRLYLMGSVFDQNGDLILIGEGWKPDVVSMIAGSVATAAVSHGAVGSAGIVPKIENVVFAILSPVDGSLKKIKTFSVGPWFDYGKLMTEGSHVLFQVGNQVISYDVNEPDIAPAPFISLKTNERLILTSSGSIVINEEEKLYTLYK